MTPNSYFYRLLIIVFSISALFSCEKKGENGVPPSGLDAQDSIALIKTTMSDGYDDGKVYTFSYEYDTKNRVVQIAELDKTGKLIQVGQEYQYAGDQLVTSKDHFNSSGILFMYTYTGDLITKITLTGGMERNFTYDINKNLIVFVGQIYGGGKDSIIYEGYVNGRPGKLTHYKINKGGIIVRVMQRRYTYDADNNMVKEELFDEVGFGPGWNTIHEYSYDLKIPNISPVTPFRNSKGIEGGIFGNPNLTSKDVDTHLSNGNVYYSYIHDVTTGKTTFFKSEKSNLQVIKSDAKGFPLELIDESTTFKKDGSVDKIKKSNLKVKYMYVKK